MKGIFTSLLILVLCALAFPYRFARAQNEGVQNPPPMARPDKDLSRLVRKHEIISLSPSQASRGVRSTGHLSLPTSEQTFELDLRLNDMRAKNYKAEETDADGLRRAVESPAVRTYKGTVRGLEDAQARFTIDDEVVEGVIITPVERYYFEPLRKYEAEASASDIVFYKKSDVIDESPGTCGVTLDEAIGEVAQSVAPKVAETLAASTTTTTTTILEVELATEADYEYVSALGGSAASNAEIISIMNQVDGVYQRELGMRFKITYQHTWPAKPADYPYTSTLKGNEILQQFTDHWNASFQGIGRDAAHMWTGKDMVDPQNYPGLIGIAWIGTVCASPDRAYGVSQRLTSVAQKYILSAHEIGHNFNAKHSDGYCGDSIMSAYIGTNFSFCPYSRGQIKNYNTANSVCLTRVQVPCSYTLTSTGRSFTPSGGSDSVGVTTDISTCRWTARSNVDWITISAGSSGTGSGTVSFTVAANMGVSRTGTLTIADSAYTVTQNAAPTISSLVLSPSPVTGSKPVTGTVTLTAPAPTGGINVLLSDNLAATTLPTSLVIPAGATSKTFTITTTTVSASQTGAVTATVGAVNKTASLTVLPPALLSLTLNKTLVLGGTTVTGTVTLDTAAPTNGVVISLSDNLASATTPANVTVPAGAKVKTFTIMTTAVAVGESGIVTAGTGIGVSKTASLATRPAGVLTVSVNPTSVLGGASITGSVALEQTALNDVTVTLLEDGSAASAPSSLVVPAGAKTKTFTINTSAVALNQVVTLSATANNITKSVLFTIKNSVAACGTPKFGTKSTIALPSSRPTRIVAEDFNQDGRLDMAVSTDINYQNASNLSLLLAKATGGYSITKYTTSRGGFSDVVAGDFNRDGKKDLAVTNGSDGTVSILLGNGAGGFSAPTNYNVGYHPGYLVVNDFNNDGKQDLAVVVSISTRNIAVLLGNGAGGFSPAINTAVNGQPTRVATGDFNHDGKADLALVNYYYNYLVTIYAGKGTGSFNPGVNQNVASNAQFVTVGDFNSDGKQDLVIGNQTFDYLNSPSEVLLATGNGAGSFSVTNSYRVDIYPSDITTGDFNNDGADDLAVSNSKSGNVSLLLKNSPGGFAQALNFAVGAWPTSLVAKDFNADGKLDLAVANADSQNVMILFNTCN